MNLVESKTSGSRLVASPRHTAIFLVILLVVSSAGAVQSRGLISSPHVSRSHLGLYLTLGGIQLLWLRYIQIGLRARGHSISEFLNRPEKDLRLGRDALWAAVTFIATQLIGLLLALMLGSVNARNAFLLPHGLIESACWVVLSLVAGFSEEIAFRGYLQTQLTAMTGYPAVALGLQAVIFGASHGYQGWKAAVVATAYGLVFGVIAGLLKNIRATAMAHAAIDIFAGLPLIFR